MATTIKTLTEFNDFIGDFFKTVLPEPLEMRDYTSHKYHVYDEIFGKGVFDRNKELTSGEAILFEDSPPGTVGVKAEGLREGFFDDAIKEIELLKVDPEFIAEIKKLFADEPSLKKDITRVQTVLISIFADRKAKCKILTIEEYNAEMEQTAIDIGNPDLVFGFLEPPTKQSKYIKFIKTIKDIMHNITYAKAKNSYKKIVEIKDKLEEKAGSSFSIVAWAGIFSGVRKIFGKIPILLGPVPLKHVDYVEIARSGKILKFRATGSVFLAKQEGGDDAIKIEGLMYKVEFWTMFWLWSLFIYGQSKFREMEDLPNLLEVQDVFQVRKMNDLIMTDTSLQRPSYEYHQTFPFVSRHFIIPNCYIETILIEDKLPLKDVLKYSILLRTYDKPKEVNWIKGDKGRALYGIKNKSLSAKICEYSLNFGWRMLNTTGWLIDETEWKIGSAMNEGVLDTYYDVDWSTLASVAYLNLIGAVT